MTDETNRVAEEAIASLVSLSEEQAAQPARDFAVYQANKAILFPALAAAGIGIVTVSFDGYGDEGQIENVEARAGESVVPLPVTSIDMMQAQWSTDVPVRHTMTVAEAIEHLAYDCLGETHPGWQDGEGAYGEFVFDVAAGSITLDHNARYTASESYTHEF